MFNKFNVGKFLFLILVIYLSNTEKLPISIHTISMNGELNSRYALRTVYNSNPNFDADLSLENFELYDQDEYCTSIWASDVSNQYIDQSHKVVGMLLEYQPNFERDCKDDGRGYLSILITENAMAAYPRFPMFDFKEDLILEGLTSYKVIQVPQRVYQESELYHRYYVSFKVDTRFVFVETKAYEVNKGVIVESLPIVLDSIYTALSDEVKDDQ